MVFRPIDLSFSVSTDLLHLDVQEAEGQHFFCKGDVGRITIFCPRGTNFQAGEFQLWFRKVVREALRREAKLILPGRLEEWSARTGLRYGRLTIKSTSSKWGSYSSKGNLNLSLYLMLLPSTMVDYTLCHELCHSVHMNHGPQFWALLREKLGRDPRPVKSAMNAKVKEWSESGDPRYLLITNA